MSYALEQLPPEPRRGAARSRSAQTRDLTLCWHDVCSARRAAASLSGRGLCSSGPVSGAAVELGPADPEGWERGREAVAPGGRQGSPDTAGGAGRGAQSWVTPPGGTRDRRRPSASGWGRARGARGDGRVSSAPRQKGAEGPGAAGSTGGLREGLLLGKGRCSLDGGKLDQNH